MKKLSILIVLLVAISLLAVSIYAAQAATVTVTASENTVAPGETVTVTVSITSVENCAAGAFMFDYNKDVFEYIDGKALVSGYQGSGVSTLNNNLTGYFMGNAQNINGDLFEITLKVKDDAALGDYTISGTPKITVNNEIISCTVSSATITVACNHTNEYTDNGDGTHTVTCSSCGNTATEAHTFSDGTCACGAKEEVEHEHTWEVSSVVEPGLDVDGYTEYTCSSCGDTKKEIIEGLRIRMTSATLMVEDIIKMRFTFKTNVTTAESMGILIYNSISEAEAHNIDAAVWHEALEHNTGNAYYGFSDGIAAADMGTSVYAVGYLKYADGTYKFSQVKEYSPVIFCQNRIGKAEVSVHEKNLCKALMHYGAAHQIYKNNGADGLTLMNQGFDTVPYVDSIVTDDGFSVVNNDPTRIKLASATMILEGAINYRIKFTIGDASLKNKEKGIEYTFMGSTYDVPIELEGNTYYAYVREVAARNMDEMLAVKAYYVDESGERIYFAELNYSGYIYAARTIATGKDPLNVELAKAFAMYVYYADVYFAKK